MLLTIPKTEAIHWEKENEIVYRGKYYDVLSKSEDEKNFIFNCYSDSHDNLLVDIFSKHTSDQQSDNTSGKRSNHSVKIIIQDFVLDTFAWKIQIVKQVKSESQILFSIASGFHSVFSPPPELR